jgi:hypothetical protein
MSTFFEFLRLLAADTLRLCTILATMAGVGLGPFWLPWKPAFYRGGWTAALLSFCYISAAAHLAHRWSELGFRGSPLAYFLRVAAVYLGTTLALSPIPWRDPIFGPVAYSLVFLLVGLSAVEAGARKPAGIPPLQIERGMRERFPGPTGSSPGEPSEGPARSPYDPAAVEAEYDRLRRSARRNRPAR